MEGNGRNARDVANAGLRLERGWVLADWPRVDEVLLARGEDTLGRDMRVAVRLKTLSQVKLS